MIRFLMTAGPGAGIGILTHVLGRVAAHAVANSTSRAVM